MRKKLILIIFLCLAIPNAGVAQILSPWKEMLERIRKVNDTRELAYDYSIMLTDPEGRQLDSIKGCLYYSSYQYYDSNNTYIAIRSDRFFCKLDYIDQTASVCALKDLVDKLHMDVTSQTPRINIPDSLLHKAGKLDVDVAPKDYTVFSFSSYSEDIPDFVIRLEKDTYLLHSMDMKMTIPDPFDEQQLMNKVVKISNVRREVPPERFRQDHLFSINNGKVVLAKKYTHYKPITLAR